MNGTGFVSGAVVQWNGTPLTTTFVSATQLTAQVPATLIATAGTATITVVENGVTSNTLYLHRSAAGPAITSLSPSTATAGGAAFTLTVNGTGFVSGRGGAVERHTTDHHLRERHAVDGSGTGH